MAYVAERHCKARSQDWVHRKGLGLWKKREQRQEGNRQGLGLWGGEAEGEKGNTLDGEEKFGNK